MKLTRKPPEPPEDTVIIELALWEAQCLYNVAFNYCPHPRSDTDRLLTELRRAFINAGIIK